LTEPSGVQIHLVETLTGLAQNLSSIRPKASINGHVSREELLALPQVHCLRICAYILRRVIKGPQGGAIHDGSTPAEKVALINVAFHAFSSIGATFGPSQSEQFRTIAITLYSELLKDEASDADLVGPTLQSLKMLLDNPPSRKDSQFERVIHGLLSACLLNIDEMRGRQGAISSRKIKSNMLASVLILTVLPGSVKIAAALVDHCCFLISQKLVEADEMALTAAHCTKTLIVASTSGNAALRQCSRLLLPGMVECLINLAASSAETEQQLAVVGEIFKAFSTLVSSLSDDLRARALGIFMPPIILLLEPTRSPPSLAHSKSVTQLLSLAAASPAAFKEATAGLNQSLTEVLEASVRQALGSKGPAADAPKPQISLRSF